MPTLPNPDLVKRKTPTPGGPSGYLRQANIGTPGADTSIGDALSRIGEEAHKFAMVEKARMDDVAIDDAKNQYLQQTLNIENEYNQIKGKFAVDQDIVKDYTTKLDGVSEKISSGFKNDSQRRAWDSYYGKAKVQFTAGVMRHKLNESDTYASETYKSTNITRIQNAHSNWSDAGAVNSSASDIVKNIAKEKIRAGWSDERTEVELKASLGPLWSGVSAQYINVKQYDMAKKILDQHKDVIGVDKYTSFHKSIEASETIDLSQEKAANILETVYGDAAQRKAARDIGGTLGDATLQRVKTFQNEGRIQRQETKRVQSENDLKWISDFGVEALETNTLTIDQVESSGLSDANKALWKQKVFGQGNTSQNKAADIMENVIGEKAQRDAAREVGGTLGDSVLQRVKTIQTEIRLQKKADEEKPSEHDSAWISDVGVEALSNNTLTIDQVESAGLSNKNEALWKTKVLNKSEEEDKESAAKSTKDKYADWLEKASINPEKYTAEDVAKDIDPNGGGLTGPQYNNVLAVLAGNKDKTSKTTAKSAEVRGKAQLKAMYDRGDFGERKKDEFKYGSESWAIYSDILVDYQQKYFEEPDVDHTDWLNARIEEVGIDELYKKIDADWNFGIPFFDESDEIISEWLTKHGKATNAKNIEAVRRRYQSRKNK